LLDVSLLNRFAPQQGDEFEILRAEAGIFGTFTSTNLPELTDMLTWNLVYSDFSVLLLVESPALAGDYNGDGIVDAADYTVWRDTSGATGIGLAADGNADLVVDAADYGIWRANFGAVAPAAALNDAGAAGVPEPATWGLMAMGLAWCACARLRLAGHTLRVGM
jgi:hypothetical protein